MSDPIQLGQAHRWRRAPSASHSPLRYPHHFLRPLHGPRAPPFLNLPSLQHTQRFHISSQDKGAPARPGIYRERNRSRYGRRKGLLEGSQRKIRASPIFRITLHQLNLCWAIPALCVGVGLTAAVADNRVPQSIAYSIGTHGYGGYLNSDMHADYVARWGVPPLWVGMGVEHDTMGAICIERGKSCMV